MWVNVAAGTLLVAITILIHSVGLLALSALLRGTVTRFRPHRNKVGTMAAMAATVFGLFLIHTVEIWVWAAAYMVVGAMSDFQHALFFSTLSFSTLGAEPVSVAPEWRLFGSIEGVNGFLLIGWSTAYLIPAWTRHGPLHEDRWL
jgi:hypothetical protein